MSSSVSRVCCARAVAATVKISAMSSQTRRRNVSVAMSSSIVNRCRRRRFSGPRAPSPVPSTCSTWAITACSSTAGCFRASRVAAPQLGAVADFSGRDRRRHPDPCAPRSLRLSTTARRAGFSRPHLLHAGHSGPVHARAARFRADSGRRCARGEPARLFEAQPGAAVVHEPEDDGQRLATIVNQTAQRGGKLIIPSFAIGRVEEVLYWLRRLEEADRIPVLPVYVDSPMAAAALRFYTDRIAELDPELQRAERDLCIFCTQRMTVIASVQQ